MKKEIVLVFFCLTVSMFAQENKQEVDIYAVVDSLLLEKNLPELEIIAAKKLIKIEADKTIYEIDKDPESKTNTFLDILRKVPFITVEGNDEIKVNGSTNFQVYLNGKPSNLYTKNPTEIFRSIPAATIERVEVITDPGARYDAEGVNGILNIITKGNEIDGYLLNLQAIAMNRMQQGSLYGTLQTGRFSISGNYTYTHYSLGIKTDYLREEYQDEIRQLSMQQNTKIRIPSHVAGLDVSFGIDSTNLLALSAMLSREKIHYDYSGTYQLSNSVFLPIYSYNQEGNKNNMSGGSSVKIDYQHSSPIRKGEQLTISYQYEYLPNDMDDYKKSYNIEGNEDSSLQYLYPFLYQDNREKRQEHTMQIDYVLPLRHNQSLELGTKHIYRNNHSQSLTLYKDLENENWRQTDYQSAVNYTHYQNILSFYASYGINKSSWGINAGLRMEHTWQHVKENQNEAEDFIYRKADWVPSLSGIYKINESHNLKAGYNLRIRRPDISYLNPTVIISGTSISYGNPTLVSEKHHRLSASYNYSSYNLSMQWQLLYSIGNNIIDEYNYLSEDGILNQTYMNNICTRGYMVIPYISYNPFANTHLSLNARIGYLDLKMEEPTENYPEGMQTKRWFGGGFANISQQFPHKWRLTVTGGYVMEEPSLGSESTSFYYYGLKLQKALLDDRLNLALNLQDFLQPYIPYRMVYSYPDYRSRTKVKQYNWQVGITVNYTLNSLKKDIQKITRTIKNDDIKSKDRRYDTACESSKRAEGQQGTCPATFPKAVNGLLPLYPTFYYGFGSFVSSSSPGSSVSSVGVLGDSSIHSISSAISSRCAEFPLLP